MSASPMPGQYRRREFEDLHVKDQQIKTTKKLCIEKNWECPINECLPIQIRPRAEIKKGAKARIGDPEVIQEAWWNWSVELLKSLEELSSMTEGDLEYAQELMAIEVDQRQHNPKSSQRKILELLLGDVQRVVDEQRKRVTATVGRDTMMTDDYDTTLIGHQQKLLEAGPDSHQYDHAHPGAQGFTGRDSGVSGLGNTLAEGISTSEFAGMPKKTRESIMESCKIAELKARAAGLRAQAAAAEAEAVQFEVRAKELREQLAALDRNE